MVLGMMNGHNFTRNHRLESIVVVGQVGKGVRRAAVGREEGRARLGDLTRDLGGRDVDSSCFEKGRGRDDLGHGDDTVGLEESENLS